ncbi:MULTISPECIES: hypothetical protein [unclassified Rhodanobacter]|uniref:Uncharacterized protein n=1 Tax=Rhodanobacter humi TaxID=1888173 RepID=A0ABV4AXE2_9GAMM
MTFDEVQTLRSRKAEAHGLAVAGQFEDGSIFFTGGTAERPLFLAFAGRRSKAAAFYSFKTEEARNAYAEKWQADRVQALEATKARKAEARKPHSLKVGDVLYTSWGYEQTNVEFYEVVSVRGSVVDLRELQQDRTESGIGMQGECRALPGQYRAGLIVGKRPTGANTVRIDSCSTAWPWDGRPKSWSSYA